MTESVPTPLLHRALGLDAAASAAMAALLTVGASALSEPLGLPTALLRGVGVALLPWVALLAWTLTRSHLPRGLGLAVVAGNLLWVTASGWILVSGLVSPTGLGLAFVIAQAAAVAVFADLQALGLRRARLA